MREKKRGFHPVRWIKELVKKIGTLNLILILVGAFFVWFNWQMLCIFRDYAAIPETYACAVIAATIGDCGICGWIRTTKDKRQDRTWQKEDEAEAKKESGDYMEVPDMVNREMEDNRDE